MTIIVYIALIALNLVLVILKRNSKISLFFTIAGQALLMCGNNMNADYSGYLWFYTNQNYSSSMEAGYVWLSKLAYSMGFDYQTFTMVFLLVTIIVMYALAYNLSDNVHLVSMLYLSTMMFLDVVQVRQFAAYVIMAYALVLHSKGKKILYCLVILFGTLFQITIIVYLPLVFLNPGRKSSKRIIVWFFVGIICVCGLIFISGSRLNFLGIFMSRFVDQDKMVYFQTRTRFGFVVYFAFQFLCVYLSWVIQQYYYDKDTSRKKNFVNSTYECTLFSSIAMPLVMLNNNFYRFFKFSLIPLFISLSYLMNDVRNNERTSIDSKVPLTKKTLGSKDFFALICVALVFGFSFLMQSESVVFDVFNNNIFLR